jgi:hypothetical protein
MKRLPNFNNQKKIKLDLKFISDKKVIYWDLN